MEAITDATLKQAYKPYDIVTDKDGNVGLIQETDMNICQDEPKHQISYSVEWLIGKGYKEAWYDHDELTRHCNIFVKIAECSCNPHGSNGYRVAELMSLGIQ